MWFFSDLHYIWEYINSCVCFFFIIDINYSFLNFVNRSKLNSPFHFCHEQSVKLLSFLIFSIFRLNIMYQYRKDDCFYSLSCLYSHCYLYWLQQSPLLLSWLPLLLRGNICIQRQQAEQHYSVIEVQRVVSVGVSLMTPVGVIKKEAPNAVVSWPFRVHPETCVVQNDMSGWDGFRWGRVGSSIAMESGVSYACSRCRGPLRGF